MGKKSQDKGVVQPTMNEASKENDKGSKQPRVRDILNKFKRSSGRAKGITTVNNTPSQGVTPAPAVGEAAAGAKAAEFTTTVHTPNGTDVSDAVPFQNDDLANVQVAIPAYEVLAESSEQDPSSANNESSMNLIRKDSPIKYERISPSISGLPAFVAADSQLDPADEVVESSETSKGMTGSVEENIHIQPQSISEVLESELPKTGETQGRQGDAPPKSRSAFRRASKKLSRLRNSRILRKSTATTATATTAGTTTAAATNHQNHGQLIEATYSVVTTGVPDVSPLKKGNLPPSLGGGSRSRSRSRSSSGVSSRSPRSESISKSTVLTSTKRTVIMNTETTPTVFTFSSMVPASRIYSSVNNENNPEPVVRLLPKTSVKNQVSQGAVSYRDYSHSEDSLITQHSQQNHGGDDEADELLLSESGKVLEQGQQQQLTTNTDDKESNLIHASVITKDNISRVRWSDAYEHLTIKSCPKSIIPVNISNSRKTLTTLKFNQLTTFKNIITILENCSNLVKLSFSNVFVVQKNFPSSSPATSISLPHLEELEMQEWLYTLTKYEYWILSFLTRSCTFGKLEKFTFQGRETVMDEGTKLEMYRKQIGGIGDPAIVAKFLVKNMTTLRKVSVGGIGFQLMPSTQVGIYGSLSSLRLTTLRCDLQTPGIELILVSQRHLQKLTCAGFLQNLNTNKAYTWITQSVANNFSTLTSLAIFPCILTELEPKDMQSLYDFDCSVFRRCSRLESLFLNITAASKQVFSQRFSCGQIHSIQLLPYSLVNVEIYTHEFKAGDLREFGKRLTSFRRLKDIVLSSTAPFPISNQMVNSMLIMESFRCGKFFGGKIDASGEDSIKDPTIPRKGAMVMTATPEMVEFVREVSH